MSTVWPTKASGFATTSITWGFAVYHVIVDGVVVDAATRSMGSYATWVRITTFSPATSYIMVSMTTYADIYGMGLVLDSSATVIDDGSGYCEI